MKMANAIAMLKRHGTNYHTFYEGGASVYFAANVAGHVLATFECALPGQAGATLNIHDDGKMSFAGKSLTKCIQLAKLKPRKLRVFTVHVEGPERHDGEKGYTYVCKAVSFVEAGRYVLCHHRREEQTDDVKLVGVQQHMPVPGSGHWNDLRKVSETVKA